MQDNMDNTTKEIAEKLKAARISKGLTQGEVAKKAALNPNYYAKVERGEASATVKTLRKLAEVLEVKSGDIFPF